MKTSMKMLVAAAAMVLGGAAGVQATTTYDANLVAPGVYNGTGNPNGGFTIANDSGIEVGLRAKYRNNGAVIDSPTNNYYVVPGAQTNATSGGNGAAANRSAWNYEFSINLNPTGAASGYLTLNDIVAMMTISDTHGHTNTVNALTYWTDNAGYNGVKNAAFTNAGTDYGAQNSENPNFADFPLASFYNMNAADTYTFTLDVQNQAGASLASDTINVTVVPVPASALSGAALLAGLGLVAGVKRVRGQQA